MSTEMLKGEASASLAAAASELRSQRHAQRDIAKGQLGDAVRASAHTEGSLQLLEQEAHHVREHLLHQRQVQLLEVATAYSS